MPELKTNEIQDLENFISKVFTNNLEKAIDKASQRLEPVIKKHQDDAILRAFMTAREKKDLDKKKIIRELEDLLRARDTIKENIAEWEQELQQLEIGINVKTSASGLVCMAQNRMSEQEYQKASQITLRAKIERDKSKMELLERGMEKVKDDDYYTAFKMKFFEGMNNAEIAYQMGDDVVNVGIKIYEILKRIAWKVYGGEIL